MHANAGYDPSNANASIPCKLMLTGSYQNVNVLSARFHTFWIGTLDQLKQTMRYQLELSDLNLRLGVRKEMYLIQISDNALICSQAEAVCSNLFEQVTVRAPEPGEGMWTVPDVDQSRR